MHGGLPRARQAAGDAILAVVSCAPGQSRGTDPICVRIDAAALQGIAQNVVAAYKSSKGFSSDAVEKFGRARLLRALQRRRRNLGAPPAKASDDKAPAPAAANEQQPVEAVEPAQSARHSEKKAAAATVADPAPGTAVTQSGVKLPRAPRMAAQSSVGDLLRTRAGELVARRDQAIAESAQQNPAQSDKRSTKYVDDTRAGLQQPQQPEATDRDSSSRTESSAAAQPAKSPSSDVLNFWSNAPAPGSRLSSTSGDRDRESSSSARQS